MTFALTVLFFAAAAAAAVWLCARFLRRNAAGEGKRTVPCLLWTAFLGLFLFFALESGICRRIGPDLFLPVQDGTMLPWRALRLGLCLDLALATGIWGGSAREKLRALLQRDSGCWLASAAVTALFFLWAWRVTVFAFMTNDDTYILRTIGSGSFWNLTSAFPHPLLGAAMNWLYRAAPDICWYAGYHLAVQAAAMTVLGRCLHLKLRRRSWPVTAGFLFHGLLGAGLFLYTLSELSFTVTPAIAGTAAVALLLCQDETDSTLSHVLTGLASAVLILLCRLQRKDTATALLCFWALAAGYQLLRIIVYKKSRRLLRAGTLLAAAALTVALLAAVERVQLPRPADTGSTAAVSETDASQAQPQTGYTYNQSEHYRSLVMDYLLPSLTDEQLETFGIPPELAVLLRSWYFMDERINTDTFQAIAAAYPDAVSDAADSLTDTGSPLSTLRNMIVIATANMTPASRRTAALMTAALGLLLALALLRLLRYGPSGALETLCALCAAGGGGLMLLYLIREGRLLIRVFLVPAIPAAAIMLLMAADDAHKPAHTRPQKAGAVLSGLLGVCLGALCLVIAGRVPYAGEAVDRQTVFASQTALESYTNAHPETTFITNALTNDADPFHDPWSYPSNLTRWGGTGVTASSDRLYADAFFRDDVLFLCQQSSTIVGLLQYLSLDNGPVQARLLAQLTPTFSVVDIDQISPGADYTGWYEHNGMTYYFRDGQALTGGQVIDGKSYTFAPAGAQSQFSAAPGTDGILYFTNAYSLVSEVNGP